MGAAVEVKVEYGEGKKGEWRKDNGGYKV